MPIQKAPNANLITLPRPPHNHQYSMSCLEEIAKADDL